METRADYQQYLRSVTEQAQANFAALRFEVHGRVATITLARPGRYNAINHTMPYEIQRAISLANTDDSVHVIVLTGDGDAFCGGYDLKEFAEAPRPIPGSQNMPWDPILDYQHMWGNTEAFMSIWKSLKPVVCKIRGGAVAGGSDIALLCDVVIMEENARIGYPPARLWGCPTTAMWVYRVGITWAKRLLLTGDLIDGRTAERIGLAYRAVSADQLDAETDEIVQRMSTVPINQLAMQKMVINQAVEAMGLFGTQKLATLMDGVSRHSPEGVAWKACAEKVGMKKAILERDTGVDITITPSKL